MVSQEEGQSRKRKTMCTFMLQSYCKLCVSASGEIPYGEDRGKEMWRLVGTPLFLLLISTVYFPVVMKGPSLFCQKVLMTHVMSARTSHVLSPQLSEAGVGVCTARARLCLVWKNGGAWKGFFHTFDGGMFCLGFFAKCVSESGRNPRGAPLLDITTVFLSTLSVLSWPQTEAHVMRKGTSLVICLLDWQSCMGEGRCGSLGMLQLSWQEIFPVRYSNEIWDMNVICL